MDINWKLLIFGATYSILIFMLQKLIEFSKSKHELKSKLFAEKRIEAIAMLFQSICELEVFVRDILVQQPENFKGKIIHDYFNLRKKTVDSINSSHIFLDENIYRKADEIIKEINNMVKPAREKAELSKYYFTDSPPIPDQYNSIWDLAQESKRNSKLLKLTYSKVSDLRIELKDAIRDKVYYK